MLAFNGRIKANNVPSIRSQKQSSHPRDFFVCDSL
jgi:hypothetical protein